MAKRQGLDDIIRDAINAVKDGAVTTGKRPKRKQKISNFLPRINDDITTDPLGSIRRPSRRPRGGEKTILPKRPSRGPRQTKDDTNRTLPKRRLRESRIPKKKRNY